mmetsp:Transcript_10734/g.37119  ORF Transcript_10734/g.37119 Transcript_10734/m.37119 type:complete len:260 (-) Transcript_10734:1757-2536(-)
MFAAARLWPPASPRENLTGAPTVRTASPFAVAALTRIPKVRPLRSLARLLSSPPRVLSPVPWSTATMPHLAQSSNFSITTFPPPRFTSPQPSSWKASPPATIRFGRNWRHALLRETPSSLSPAGSSLPTLSSHTSRQPPWLENPFLAPSPPPPASTSSQGRPRNLENHPEALALSSSGTPSPEGVEASSRVSIPGAFRATPRLPWALVSTVASLLSLFWVRMDPSWAQATAHRRSRWSPARPTGQDSASKPRQDLTGYT